MSVCGASVSFIDRSLTSFELIESLEYVFEMLDLLMVTSSTKLQSEVSNLVDFKTPNVADDKKQNP